MLFMKYFLLEDVGVLKRTGLFSMTLSQILFWYNLNTLSQMLFMKYFLLEDVGILKRTGLFSVTLSQMLFWPNLNTLSQMLFMNHFLLEDVGVAGKYGSDMSFMIYLCVALSEVYADCNPSACTFLHTA